MGIGLMDEQQPVKTREYLTQEFVDQFNNWYDRLMNGSVNHDDGPVMAAVLRLTHTLNGIYRQLVNHKGYFPATSACWLSKAAYDACQDKNIQMMPNACFLLIPGQELIFACRETEEFFTVKITDVSYHTISSVPDEVWKCTGCKDCADGVFWLKALYPDITLDSPLTIIRWQPEEGGATASQKV